MNCLGIVYSVTGVAMPPCYIVVASGDRTQVLSLVGGIVDGVVCCTACAICPSRDVIVCGQ
ncbi:hypothetical protein F4859DRAFT_497761 [Xylaria cf. heliscus]|nr:hypothetical protein F4859DRAFT_497761 [Xylaria cf. heliscus]